VKRSQKVFVFTQSLDPDLYADDKDIKVVRFQDGRGVKTPLSTLKLNLKDLQIMLSVLWYGQKELLKLVRSEKIDICIAAWAVPAGFWSYLVKRKLGTPYVVWTLGSDIWDYGRKPITNRIVSKVLRKSDYVYADGFDLANETKKLSGRKCSFLPSSRILPQPGPQEHTMDLTKTNFLYIGRYHKNKGIDILIDSIYLLPEEIKKNVRFHIFGKGSLHNSMKANLSDYHLDEIVYLNSYANESLAAKYFSLCDCLIIPSRIESIPVVLSDALQTSTPVIVTDVGDMGDLVRIKNAGIVVEPENPEQLRDAIVNFHVYGGEKYKDGVTQLSNIFDVSKSASKVLRKLNQLV